MKPGALALLVGLLGVWEPPHFATADAQEFNPSLVGKCVQAVASGLLADLETFGYVRGTCDGRARLLEEHDGDESESEAGADVDPLEVNRIATKAVANAGGRLADFEVFCATVEATQDTLLQAARAEN